MYIYTPYTYLIGWSKHNKWYYGVRYSKKCNPSDLWVKYFTSSSYVQEFRKIYGEPDVIQVRKTFDNEKSARLWELKVLRKMNVLYREDFLNQAISLAMSPSAASKAGKISGQKRTKEQKVSFGLKAAKARSKSMTTEQKRECGIRGMKSRWGSMTPEERSLYNSKRMEKVPFETCVHCGRTLRKNQITRFHNDNCKSKQR